MLGMLDAEAAVARTIASRGIGIDIQHDVVGLIPDRVDGHASPAASAAGTHSRMSSTRVAQTPRCSGAST